MTAYERLQYARECFRSGRHDEALDGFIWFHQNALSEEPALDGVRLSFALGNWVDLAEQYPPAMRALTDLLAQKSSGLLAGDLDESAFVDIVAINECIKSTPSTYVLFQDLLRLHPELADRCSKFALPSVVDAKDYSLATQIAPDAETSITVMGLRLNSDVNMLKHREYSRAPTRWAYVCNYVDSIQLLLKIRDGCGDKSGAARLKALAIAIVESPSLRREVQRTFIKRPNAPVHRDFRRRR